MMAKTAQQLLRRARVSLPMGQTPPGFRRHNWLLVTGNVTSNCWVRTKPSDHRDGTVKAWSF